MTDLPKESCPDCDGEPRPHVPAKQCCSTCGGIGTVVAASITGEKSIRTLRRYARMGVQLHAHEVASLEAEIARWRKEVRRLQNDALMSCEDPCGSCCGCQYAHDTRMEKELTRNLARYLKRQQPTTTEPTE